MMKRKRSFRMHPFFIRLLNWEFWSFGMIYFWIYPVWFYYCIKAGSLFYFNASNPSIKNGGFLAESKKDIHDITDESLLPPTEFFPAGSSSVEVLNKIAQRSFSYPLIGKPDIGGRGRGVKKLQNEQDLINYVETSPLNFHVQVFVDLPLEAGIFYYRFPGKQRGMISGIVSKEFLSVTGDGKQTIAELLLSDKRSVLQFNTLKEEYGEKIQEVLLPGEQKILVPYGNHARGAKFLDISHKADEELITAIDTACRGIKDFYYGRLDIRYRNWDLLRQGKEFCIIEINGAGSEPTHIFDPGHSLFFAWREIIRHWAIMYKISKANHKLGHPYLTFKQGVNMFREDREQSRLLKLLSDSL